MEVEQMCPRIQSTKAVPTPRWVSNADS